MMDPRRFAIIAAGLFGTAIIAAVAILHLSNTRNTPASSIDEQATKAVSVAAPMTATAETSLQDSSQPEASLGEIAAVATPELAYDDGKEAVSSAETPDQSPLAPETQPVQIAAASVDDVVHGDSNAAVSAESVPDLSYAPSPEVSPDARQGATSTETHEECLEREVCIDQYLWSVYQRAPKEDTIKVVERRKVTVKINGKAQTVVKEFTTLVDEDFAWKDPKAAEKAGMSLIEYVIGGMDREFKLKLYHAFRAMDDARLSPGITSAFRDDYRQSLASGLKAAINRSFHGGSLRGGYGHGLAVDVVSAKGETRAERFTSSESLWKWIDVHGKEFGIGRPYLDKDPAHVAPTDGKEYAAHRGTNRLQAQLELNKRNLLAARDTHGLAKPARTAGSSSFR